MKTKKHQTFTYLLFAPLLVFGQIDSISSHLDLESVSIHAVSANDKTPVSFQTISKSGIEKLNNGNSIPTLLQFSPSVVTTTENGTGTGNTSFRIRGTDASRTNVMINGLPLNNPESQSVFWVNLPNLSGFLNSIQVQRGVGTSSNGSGAFGATVNLETDKIAPKPSLDVSVLGGSYKTFGVNLSANTGLLKNGLFAEAKYSKNNSDGYIRNGKTDHQSAYLSAGLVKSKHFLKFNYMYGQQHTGATWDGATKDQIAVDRRYNPAGEYTDDEGNTAYYDNETDNYFSNIAQLFYVYNISDNLIFNAGFNYTNGFGYTESYKTDQSFNDDFGLSNQTVDNIVYEESDVIRQKLMRNNFYAGNANIQYSKNNLNVNIGGSYSYYTGDHYGAINWVKYNENILKDYEWYRNKGSKSEVSVFTKFDYLFSQKFNAFLDVQYRSVKYDINGKDDDLSQLEFSKIYPFFNPKIGLSFHPDASQKWYVSVSKSSREPARADIKEILRAANYDNMVKPEHLIDYELGYQIQKEKWGFGGNFYFMNYKDQLVPNGRVNSSYYALMDNVAKSYRTGIELVGSWQICKPLKLDANLTLSQNKIQEHRKALLDPITWEFAEYETLKSADLAYSPNVVGAGILTYSPIKNLDITLTGKYVGKQYFDNFSTKENALEAYFVSDLSVYYAHPLKKEGRKVYIQGMVNNLFNNDYISNAFVYTSYFTDGTNDGSDDWNKVFFVQAPIHFSIKIGITL
jgi:iron complex outermembrane receptor protein